MQKQAPTEQVSYRFTRVKDTHFENGRKYITLFGRLTREGRSGTESVWVELEEVAWSHASQKLKSMPNAFRAFSISENVFRELAHVSVKYHRELYFITPIHHHSEFQRLGYTETD